MLISSKVAVLMEMFNLNLICGFLQAELDTLHLLIYKLKLYPYSEQDS